MLDFMQDIIIYLPTWFSTERGSSCSRYQMLDFMLEVIVENNG